MYGHFGQGVLHCRIDFDLVTEAGLESFRRYMDEAAELVVSMGGSLSGEHGDGQARGELLPVMFGAEIVGAFEEFKDHLGPGGPDEPGQARPAGADPGRSAARDRLLAAAAEDVLPIPRR